jgi:hypothetical protein
MNKLLYLFFAILLPGGSSLLLGCLPTPESNLSVVTAPTVASPTTVHEDNTNELPPTLATAVVTVQPFSSPPVLTPTPGKTIESVIYELDTLFVDPSIESLQADDYLFLQTATPIPFSNETRIGFSAQGRPIVSHRLGYGATKLIFIGGIHGGYEWNTILLAYQMLDYLTNNPELIPDNLTVYIIPSANPDGQFLVTGTEERFLPSDVRTDSFPGRFNGNGVDLNRNWDCNWSPVAFWRQEQINSGPYAFSEPENQALRDFLLEVEPAAVIFWHSAANAVFAAGCPDLYLPSYQLATIYGRAANYPIRDAFTSYTITGDATDWLATQGVPAITVELINHYDLDWEQNRAGVLAVLTFFACCTLHP